MADRQGSAAGLGGEAAGCLAAGESTRKLLKRARSGDGQALNVLFSRYLTPLERWARGRLPAWARGVADTDDLVKETLLSSLRGVEAFEPHHSGAFQAYLRQGILNRMRDEIRRARRRPRAEIEEEKLADPGPSPIEEAIGREVLERYETALQKLKAEDREAILARIELGFGYQQLAGVLGKASPDAARMAVSRALVRLSREMAHGGP